MRNAARVKGFSKNERLLAWTGIGVLAFVIWSKVRAISNLIFSPGNVTGIDMVGSVPFIYFTVFVQNTAGTGVTVDSFAGNLWANNQLIGNVSSFQPVYLAPNSQTVVPITAQLGLLGIVNDLITSFSTGAVQQQIEVKGFANGVGFQVPISIKLMVGV